METDNDYDAALDYINWDNLAEYSETMGLFADMVQGVRDLAPGGAAYGNRREDLRAIEQQKVLFR